MNFSQDDPNRRSPILNLPFEILSRISLLAIHEDRIQTSYEITGDSTWNWYQIGHICQRWRCIVLNSPNLWAVVKVRNPSMRRELIQRSKPVPLELEVNFEFGDVEEFIDIVRGEMHRLRRLTIYCRNTEGVTTRFLGSLIDAYAPALECLTVYASVYLPPVLFIGGAPRLQKLVLLNSMKIDWGFNLFHSGLTELDLIDIDELEELSEELELVEFLTTLAPTVKTIRIKSMTLPSLSTPNVLGPVLLPNLRTIDLWGDTEGCSYIMSHISLPPRPVNMEILPAGLTSVDQLNSILPWIAQNMAVKPDTYEIAHVIFTNDYSVLRFILESPTTATKIQFWPDTFGLNQSESNPVYDAIQLATLTTLPVSAVKTLCIRDNSPKKETLLNAYTQMRAVEKVTINPRDYADASSYEEFCAALGEMGDNEKPILFPKLRELVIDDWEFEDMDWELAPYNRPAGKLLVGEALANCLRVRKEAGFPLDLLKIKEDLRVTKADLVSLEGCVGSVEWGGDAESDLESGSGSGSEEAEGEDEVD